MARIDLSAVATAAGGGLAVIVAGAAVSGSLASRTGDWVVWLFLVLIVAGFTVTGLLAGRRRTDTPVLHGAIAAAVAFVVALAIGLVIAALRDRSISAVAVPVAALVAVTAGVGGALAADALHRRTRRRDPAGG